MQKNKKRRAFSKLEDESIRQYVAENGENWDEVAKKLPGRTAKQCHDRYSNYLRDGLKTEPWTEEEDAILIAIHNEIGPKWVKMMSQLPGRSGNDIKNRWHKHLVKKEKHFFDQQNNKVKANLIEPAKVENISASSSYIVEPIFTDKSKIPNINSGNDFVKVKSIEIKKDIEYLPLPKINFNLFNMIDFSDKFLDEIFNDFEDNETISSNWDQYLNFI